METCEHIVEHPSQNSRAVPYSVLSLKLTNYRNYDKLNLEIGRSGGFVVLCGKNGSGKTNILEAISLLAPGKGLRSSNLSEITKHPGDNGGWVSASSLATPYGTIQVGTAMATGGESNKRVVKINGEVVKSQAELAENFAVMWLTPQMDGLLNEGTTIRRKFMDRLVFNFDAEHAKRVFSYEYVVRQRMKLLQSRSDPNWLDILEQKIAEKAVAIAAARNETIQIIQETINSSISVFPKAMIACNGYVEEIVQQEKALAVEGVLKQQLKDNRQKDKISGRTSVGPHRSDLEVIHADKNINAKKCSTGEQKALLLAIILAEARAKAKWKNSVPVLLLDEVVAHLDNVRKEALFDELKDLGAQCWLTGTDSSRFASLKDDACFYQVDNGVVR